MAATGTPSPFRPSVEAYPLERIAREVRLDPGFSAADFERAFERFVHLYNVPPLLARCTPEILDRFCSVFECGDEAARTREVRFRGVPVHAAVVAAGTIVFEGEVEEDRMGDW